LLVRLQQRLLDKRNHFIQHRQIAGDADVERCDKRQPQEVVRKTCANTASARRVPPVLHVAFLKLMTCGQKDLTPGNVGAAVDERHNVLQLVSKAEGAA
jgi:hypothetical protein